MIGGGLMNYPNGSKPKPNNSSKMVKKPKMANKAHLGIDFEDLINQSNTYYLEKDRAVIYKKPTPIRITKVDYPSRNRARIIEAFYQVPSTTDYNGIYRGKYIDFEAKSCNGKSFSFTHLYAHQINHLIRVARHGGIAFLIIMFNDFREVFMLPVEKLESFYLASLEGGRKSISYEVFKTDGYPIKIGLNPALSYLDTVDMVYFSNMEE